MLELIKGLEVVSFTGETLSIPHNVLLDEPDDRRQLVLPAHCLNKNRYPTLVIDSIQMLPTFRCTGDHDGSSHEIRDSWPPSSEGTRCNASANPICAFLMPAIRLIDTRLASHRGHYVNSAG